MKKTVILLTALSLLLLLCGCTSKAESTDVSAESATAQTTAATTGQTPSDAKASDPSDTEGVEGSSGEAQASTDDNTVVIITEPTEPTIGTPTPVEPPYETEANELPPDTFE